MSERLLILDTETTGLDPQKERVIEIGCVEVLNRKISDVQRHWYINPNKPISQQAFAIHGLSNEFLSDKPLFFDIAEDFLAFIGDSKLVAHNASFDINFLNAELQRNGFSTLSNPVEDTLKEARKKHFGQPNNLDALCRRYFIDNSSRSLHGALLDATLLAQVYLSMCMKQHDVFVDEQAAQKHSTQSPDQVLSERALLSEMGEKMAHLVRVNYASSQECLRHENFFDDEV